MTLNLTQFLRLASGVFGATCLCYAQTMNFSVYTNVTASSDFTTMYNNVSVSDNSTCSHSGYSTTAMINSPDGRGNSGTQSGLNANTSLPINLVTGNYSVSASVRYYCSCARTTAGAGGGHIVGVGINGATFKFGSKFGADGCAYNLDCDSPPTCPKINPGSTPTIINDYQPCGAYWIQQFGSIIYSDGTRSCYQIPDGVLRPPYTNGKSSTRPNPACT